MKSVNNIEKGKEERKSLKEETNTQKKSRLREKMKKTRKYHTLQFEQSRPFFSRPLGIFPFFSVSVFFCFLKIGPFFVLVFPQILTGLAFLSLGQVLMFLFWYSGIWYSMDTLYIYSVQMIFSQKGAKGLSPSCTGTWYLTLSMHDLAS